MPIQNEFGFTGWIKQSNNATVVLNATMFD
jgi:hypothetical protein